MATDPLIEILGAAQEDPVGTVARAFGYLEATRAANPTGYFAGVRALAMSIRNSQPAFAFALANYVAETGDPVGGARTAIRLKAEAQPQPGSQWALLLEAIKAVPHSNVLGSNAQDLELHLPLVANAARGFRGVDPLGLRLGSLYCLGQLRVSPKIATEYEDLLIALVDSASRGSIRSWLEDALTWAPLPALTKALG